MRNQDEAEKIAKGIFEDIKANISNIKSEEDSKIQIINRILNECLDWPYTDFRAENKHDNGYSDYICSGLMTPDTLIRDN